MRVRQSLKTALFLDIDGVLHPQSAVRQEVDGRGLDISGEGLLRWAPLLWPVIEPTSAWLVVHSAWRHHYRLDEIVAMFPTLLRDRITDVTTGAGRYESVIQYVERYRIGRFAVLDDMPGSFPPGWPHLIACDPETGISDTRVRDRIRHFLRYAAPRSSLSEPARN